MKRYMCLILLLGVMLFAYEGQPLSLTEFIQQAAVSNTNLKEILMNRLLVTPNYYLSATIEEWTLNAGIGSYFSSGSSQPAAEIGVSRKFLLTGADLSGSYAKAISSQSGAEYQTYSLEVAHPLLKNNLGYADRLENAYYQLNKRLSFLTITESYEDYLYDLIDMYYSWYTTYLDVLTAKRILEDFNVLMNDVQERKKNHIARETDLNKVRIQVLDKRESLMQKQIAYQTFERKIKQAVNSPNMRVIRPIFAGGFSEITTLSISQGYEQSRFKQKLEIEEEMASINVKLNRDGLNLPAEFIMQYTKTDYLNSNSSDSQRFYAGISLTSLSASQHDRANVEKAEANYNIVRLGQKNLLDDWTRNMREIKAEINQQLALIDIYERKIQYLEAVAKDERSDYFSGRASLNELITAMNNLDNAKQDFLQKKLELEQLRIAWLTSTDKLINRL